MKFTFSLKGPSGPFCDPYLYLRFYHTGRAILFDLGDLSPLVSRDILRITDVFVSHAHMDHFIGFDHLVRLHLPRTSSLNVYGPAGLIDHVEGKLSGFTWNLTDDYLLKITVKETDGDTLSTSVFRAATGFAREDLQPDACTGTLLDEKQFAVVFRILDHGIPCLGFRLEEKIKVNIQADALKGMGLVAGPWLSVLKENVIRGSHETTSVRVKTGQGTREMSLAELASVYKITRGHIIAYIVDAADTAENEEKIIELSSGADILYMEAAFLDSDKELASARKHITAGRAGMLAAAADVEFLRIFHLSPRYEGKVDQILAEAGKGAGRNVAVQPGWKEGKSAGL